jgi:HSP20 family protein
MNLVHFEPWTVADMLRRDFARAPGRQLDADRESSPVTDWTPAVDVVEKTDRFELRADVPGVSPEDIDVSMDGGVLSISGERRVEPRSEDDGIQRIERASGRFSRRFTMPDTADAEGIQAKTSNGILEVSIPKLPEMKARRITVEAA